MEFGSAALGRAAVAVLAVQLERGVRAVQCGAAGPSLAGTPALRAPRGRRNLRLWLAPPLLYNLHEGFSDAFIGRFGTSDAFAAEIAPFDVFLLVARPARSRLLRSL